MARQELNGVLDHRLRRDVGGAAVHLLMSDSDVTVVRAGQVGLLWLGVVFYGAATLLSGLQHLLVPDRIAEPIGWPHGSGFQFELGRAEAGWALPAS